MYISTYLKDTLLEYLKLCLFLNIHRTKIQMETTSKIVITITLVIMLYSSPPRGAIDCTFRRSWQQSNQGSRSTQRQRVAAAQPPAYGWWCLRCISSGQVQETTTRNTGAGEIRRVVTRWSVSWLLNLARISVVARPTATGV